MEMKAAGRFNDGFTLIEILIAIAIIGVIAVTFMPLFVMSAKTNVTSETTLDSTYLGKDAMELAYELSREINYEDVESELDNKGYTKISENKYRIIMLRGDLK